MRKIIYTALVGAIIGLFFFIPQEYVSNYIDKVLNDKVHNKTIIKKKIDEFYKPLDILLTASLNDWKYLNKNNLLRSYWMPFTFNKKSIKFKISFDKVYKIELNNFKCTVNDNLILLFGESDILDINNTLIGKGMYSKLIMLDYKQNTEIISKDKLFVYNIKIFDFNYPLDYIVSKTSKKTIKLQKSLYPIIEFGLKSHKLLSKKYITRFSCQVYKDKYLRPDKILNENFKLQYEDDNQYVLSNLTIEKRNNWVKYMLYTFKPYHEKIESLVLQKGYLVEDKKMKHLLEKLLFHIDGYKRVFKEWENNNYTNLTSSINFPSEINQYTKERIKILEKLLK